MGAVLLLPSVFLPGRWAEAAETVVTPYLELREEYVDNLLTSSTHSLGSFITRVTPGVRAAAGTESMRGTASARFNSLTYSANSGMNDIEQLYDSTGVLLLSPRLKLSASAAYQRQSAPDREIETVGQSLDVVSRRQNYGTGAEYRLEELTTLSLGYGYEQVAYDNTVSYSDVRSHGVTAAVEHDAGRLVPQLRLRGAARYTRSDFSIARIDYTELTGGASYRLNEVWSVSADGGGGFTGTAFTLTVPAAGGGTSVSSGHNDSRSWLAKGGLEYRHEYDTAALTYGRSVSTTSGSYGVAVTQDTLSLNLSRRISWECSVRLTGGYIHNRAEREQQMGGRIEENSWRAGASVRYEFSRDLIGESGYEYYQFDNTVTGRSAQRNRVFVQLTAQTNFFE